VFTLRAYGVGGSQPEGWPPMDIVATALTAAWLDAVRRTRMAVPLNARQQGPADTFTEVVESALRHGGLDSLDSSWVDPTRIQTIPVDPTRPGQVIDLSV